MQRSNEEFVARVLKDFKSLTKDGRINRRAILATGQDKARFLIAQKYDELKMSREDGVYTSLKCFEFEPVSPISCSILEFLSCNTVMKSKSAIPSMIIGKLGPAIGDVSSIDSESSWTYVTPRAFRNIKRLKYQTKRSNYYTLKDGHLYLPDPNSQVEALDIEAIIIEKYKTVDVCSCEEKEPCKSYWEYEFVCPDRFYDLVVKDTVEEMNRTYKTSVEDTNPNLDANIKGKNVR